MKQDWYSLRGYALTAKGEEALVAHPEIVDRHPQNKFQRQIICRVISANTIKIYIINIACLVDRLILLGSLFASPEIAQIVLRNLLFTAIDE